MTKEELINWIRTYDDCEDKYLLLSVLDEFFSQNVCIPKGANRHPYADVLHELSENSLLEYEVSQMNFISWGKGCMLHETAYRIKPLEPVYEWQWYVVSDDTNEPRLIGWNTEEEREKDTFWSSGVYRMEETKRVRQ